MLVSLLRLEELLKCELCGNLLRSTKTLNECGHRFCHRCIYDRVGEDRQCPTCHMPAIVKNLRKDRMHDTLVSCIKKLKTIVVDTDIGTLSLPKVDTILSHDSDRTTTTTTTTTSTHSLPQGHSSESNIDQHDLFQMTTNATSNCQQRRSPCNVNINTQPPSARRPMTTVSSPTVVSPVIDDRHSTSDLLLAMEEEEAIGDDDEPDDDHNTTRTLANHTQNHEDHGNKPVIKQQETPGSTDELLQALASENIISEDEEEPDSDISPSLLRSNQSSQQNLVPWNSVTSPSPSPSPSSSPSASCLTFDRRRPLPSDIDQLRQEPTTKHQKTAEDTPASPSQVSAANESTQRELRWRCSTCLFRNKDEHTSCGVCRKERGNGISTTAEMPTYLYETSDTMILSTTHLSSTDSVYIPATVGIDMSTMTAPQRTIVRLMFTGLTSEDNIGVDTAMAMAIGINMKMEILSDIRGLDEVTHLVTSVNDHGLCMRTSKYLMSILTGKWIVNTSWLTDSIQSGYWLPEDNYEVVGDKTSGETHGPRRGRQQYGDEDRELFGDQDLRFFFYGDFPDYSTKSSLLQLVRRGGGKILSRRPPMDQLRQPTLITIVPSTNGLLNSKKKMHAWLQHCSYVKDIQWLLNTVARSECVLET